LHSNALTSKHIQSVDPWWTEEMFINNRGCGSTHTQEQDMAYNEVIPYVKEQYKEGTYMQFVAGEYNDPIITYEFAG